MGTDYAAIGEGMKTAVPWVGSNGVEFEHIGPDKVVATIADDARQHNHVGGLHAAMIFGVGETASGALLLTAFAEQLGRATPLVVTAEIGYRKVALGPRRRRGGRRAARGPAPRVPGARDHHQRRRRGHHRTHRAVDPAAQQVVTTVMADLDRPAPAPGVRRS